MTGHDSTRARWGRFRFSIVGLLLARPPEHGEPAGDLERLAQSWRHPTTGEAVRFSVKTIERWLYLARNHPVDPVGAPPPIESATDIAMRVAAVSLLGGCVACSGSDSPAPHPPHQPPAPTYRAAASVAPSPPKLGLAAAEQPFTSCFHQLRHSDPAAMGRVTLEATLNEDGSATDVEGSADAPLQPMIGCLTEALEATPFGRMGTPAKVRFPLFFTRDGVVAVGAAMTVPDPPELLNLEECVRQESAASQPSSATMPDAAAVVEAMRGDFRDCYQRLLFADRDAQGSGWFTARVDATGAVSSIVYYVQPALLGAVSCLSRPIDNARFAPPTRGAATVCIPITFVRQ